jgi:hypothetical protein
VSARSRAWATALLGVVMLASCVGFFVVTSARADQLRRIGVVTEATVVDSGGPSAWPLFNNGWVEVLYQTPDGFLTRRIWLDDPANRVDVGEWTVVYDPHHPGRVLSLTDDNSPYPWAAPFLLVGLLGAIALITAGWTAVRIRWPRRREAVLALSPDAVRIPLLGAWYARHKPYLAIDGDALRLHLPSIFRYADLVVPRSSVWVVDDVSQLDDRGDNWVFQREVVIPYALTTASDFARPNMTLLFSQPQRVPSLRFFGSQNIGLSWRRARSPEGVSVDGIAVRVREPIDALAALHVAGVSRTPRLVEWLREHRAISYDPQEIAKSTSSRRRWRVVSAVSLVGVFVLGSAPLIPDRLGWLLIAVLASGVTMAAGLPWWARRRDQMDFGRQGPTRDLGPGVRIDKVDVTSDIAMIEVRLLPWRLKARVMKPEHVRDAAGYIDPSNVDDVTGLVVVLAVWLGIVLAAPLIVLILAGLLFAIEAPILLALGVLYLVARFAGLMPWTVLTVEKRTGQERRETTRNLLHAVRRVRDINRDRRVLVRWAFS